MEFVVKKTDFLREIGLSQRIVEKKNTIPILANLLIEAKDGQLTLNATDLEVGLRNACEAKVQKRGSLTVSAKKLFEIVRALPEEEIRIKSNESFGLTIASGRANFRLVGLDPKDFPNVPECTFEGAWNVDSALFRRLLGKVLFAVTQDDLRFPLSGVLVLASAKGLRLVATDGHRLAVSESTEGGRSLTAEARLLIPRKALVELKQVLEMGNGTLSCETRDNHVNFRIGERTLVARMIEDQFPAYDKVVPKSNDKKIMVDRVELEGAVRRASLLSSEKARAVKFSFGKGKLTLSASNPELGEVHEEIPVNDSKDEFEIGFNAQYVLDFLGVVETDEVCLELKDGATQALVRPGNPRSSEETPEKAAISHYGVIMPMRL